jgi:hypothetical protein
MGRNPAHPGVIPALSPFTLSCAWPSCLDSDPLLVPACRSEQPSGPAYHCHHPPWSRLERNRSKGKILAPYEIFTKSEPISIKVGLEIESNLLARSLTENPIKSNPDDRRFHQIRLQTLASLPAVVAPLHHLFHPNQSLVEHRRNLVVPLQHTPSRANHQGGLPSMVNQEEDAPSSPALDVTHRFLIVSKMNSLRLYGS